MAFGRTKEDQLQEFVRDTATQSTSQSRASSRWLEFPNGDHAAGGESSPRSLSPTSSARLTMSVPLPMPEPMSGPLLAKVDSVAMSGPLVANSGSVAMSGQLVANSGSVAMSGPLAFRTEAEVQRDYDEEMKAALRIRFSVDLAFAAKRQLGFLRSIDSLPCLHKGPAVVRAIRRYQKFWMPLVADSLKFDALLNVDAKGKSLLPPMDVQWIWHCHRLNPVGYRQYCISKFGRVIDCPLFPDIASESFAQERCRRLWSIVYQKEPYDIMSTFYKFPGNPTAQVVPVDDIDGLDELLSAVTRQTSFYYYVSQPYMWEEPFLQASVERYKCFLHLLSKSKGKTFCIPTFDIDLIWHAHQLLPGAYAKDTKALLGSVAELSVERGPGTKLGMEGFEQTAGLWESTFGICYEKAGSMYRNTKPVNVPPPPVSEMKSSLMLEKPPAFLPWDHRLPDHNPTKYPVLTPRHVLQVCILIKCGASMIPIGRENADLFIRLRTLDASTSLKLETPVVPFTQDPQWQKLWVLQCEMKTKGVQLELRYHVEGCMKSFQKTKRVGSGTKLAWADLAKAPGLSHEIVVPLRDKRFNSVGRKQPLQLKLDVSVTPPVQASYLLKSVPDRVTDDTGAMLSPILARRRSAPQSGRWITRTVFSHTHHESFVIRIRAAKGAWRKSGERPIGVDWNERIISIHEGGWSYLSSNLGVAPEKIVATASPLAHELEEYKLSWALSTGETLVISRQLGDIHWERNLEFTLKTSGRGAGLARLVNGRKQQYEVEGASPQEEEGFVTLIRYGSHAPQGKATALFNFKISAMEVAPEEDVVLVLLLCTATMRSIADFGGLTAGNEYTRQRGKEKPKAARDWGAVVMESNGSDEARSLGQWYWNGGGGGVSGGEEEEEKGEGERMPASENKAVDWSGTEQGMISTSSRRLPSQSPKVAIEDATPTRSITSSTPSRGSSGRRNAASLQINHKVQAKRPLTFS